MELGERVKQVTVKLPINETRNGRGPAVALCCKNRDKFQPDGPLFWLVYRLNLKSHLHKMISYFFLALNGLFCPQKLHSDMFS